MKNHETILELVCRLYVYTFLNIYGLGKIAGGQFYRRGNLPDNVAQLTLENADAYSLAWTFMGYSYGYILFIGISQVVGAWLLLWNKTKLIGVMILIPIMVNIIVFDIFFLETKGALVNAILYFMMLLAILYFNRVKMQLAIQQLLKREINNIPRSPLNKIRTYIIAILIAAILFAIDQSLVNLVGH